jgi:hypothetical protein
VWTGTEMIVWSHNPIDGGLGAGPTGARYEPGTDTWAPMAGEDAPAPLRHDAVWTGSEMLVLGTSGFSVTGGRYQLATDTWSLLTLDGAPPLTEETSTIWADSHMIIWGGRSRGSEAPGPVATGHLYAPSTDTWSLAADPGPLLPPRYGHSAVWTGEAMIVWGGQDERLYLHSGAAFRF